MTQLQEGLHNRTPIDPMAVLTNYQQRHKGKVPFGGDPNLLRHLQEKVCGEADSTQPKHTMCTINCQHTDTHSHTLYPQGSMD